MDSRGSSLGKRVRKSGTPGVSLGDPLCSLHRGTGHVPGLTDADRGLPLIVLTQPKSVTRRRHWHRESLERAEESHDFKELVGRSA